MGCLLERTKLPYISETLFVLKPKDIAKAKNAFCSQQAILVQHILGNLGFNYASLGDLSNDIPGRLERIAYCRNLCLEEMNSSNKYKKCQYVVVADLDGVNNLLTKNSVKKPNLILN